MEIKELLQEMVRLDASDIYITADLPPVYRKDGVNIPSGTKKLTAEDTCNFKACKVILTLYHALSFSHLCEDEFRRACHVLDMGNDNLLLLFTIVNRISNYTENLKFMMSPSFTT